MKNNDDLYLIIKNSLKGETLDEKLTDVNDRIFMNDMIDRWTREDYVYSEVLHKIKDELEKELNGK